MSETYDPMDNFIRVTMEEKRELTGELLDIYEELTLGLCYLASDTLADAGRRRIASATLRIGKLLGLDKITKAADESGERLNE